MYQVAPMSALKMLETVYSGKDPLKGQKALTMPDKGNIGEADRLCPDCGKRIAGSSRAGSLTSYLFQPFSCTCADGSGKGQPGPGSGTPPEAGPHRQQAPDKIFCPVCGLQRATSSQLGSLTGFLFQNTRCKCAIKEQSADGEMAERFWQLRQAEGGTTFDGTSMATDIDQTVPRASVGLRPGAVIGGAYRIIRLIGKGGMGEVYLALHLALGKNCALKVIPPEQVTEDGWQRFQNEARAIAELDHINLVKVTDLGVHQGCLPIYAMEYVDGVTLDDLLKSQGPMPLKETLDILIQICEGLDFAHRRGMVHRDLKPTNIMLVNSQSRHHSVKILDFGLIKLTQKDRHQQSLTAAGDVFGSPFYMSPEQCVGDKIDNRSDIYSLGCVLFEILTGRPPFDVGRPVQILINHQTADPPTLDSRAGAKAFPEAMEVVLAKLLRKNPAERYQTLLELRGDLEKVARGEEVQPVYFSRTKQNPLSPTGGSNGVAPGEAYETRRAKGWLKWHHLAIAVILTGGAAAICILPLMRRQPTTKPMSIPLSSAVTLKETDGSSIPGPASSKENTPYSTIVEEGGKKWRYFDFPQDCTLGQIGDKGGNISAARGRLRYAEAEKLDFKPSLEALRYPAYLKRFRPGDIYQIKMTGANVIDGTSSDEALEKLTLVPGVRRLNLSSCDDLTDKCVSTIGKFSSLTKLDLGASEIHLEKLSKLSTLKQLEVIKIMDCQDVSSILKSLRDSTNLKALQFSAPSTDFDALSSIETWPQLEELIIETVLPDNPAGRSKFWRQVGNAKKLKVLMIAKLVLSVKDKEAIAQSKSLQRLQYVRVAPTNTATSAATLQALCKMPQLTYLDVKAQPLSDQCLSYLQSSPSLEAINVGPEGTDKVWLRQQIKAFPKLHLGAPEPGNQSIVINIRLAHPYNPLLFAKQ